MNRRRTVLIAAALAGGLAWLLWPAPPPPPPRAAAPEPPPTAQAPRPLPAQPELVVLGDDTGFSDEEAYSCVIAPEGPALEVHCPLPAEIAVAQRGTVRMQRAGGAVFVAASVSSEGLRFSVPGDTTGVGVLEVPGWSPLPLRLDGAGCVLEAPVADRMAITGVVHSDAPLEGARVTVHGCGGYALVDEDGSFYVEVDAEPCALFAARQDGGASARGPLVWLDPEVDGLEPVLSLELPPWPVAGVGVSMVALDDGDFEIVQVSPGSPADEADLQPGDVIEAVDGEALVGLSSWERADLLSGPPETDVRLRVWVDGEAEEIRLRRALLD